MRQTYKLVGAVISAGLLAACGGNNGLSSSTPLSVTPQIRPLGTSAHSLARSLSGSDTVLYSFRGGKKDGDIPIDGIIDVNGVLYGTTNDGGASSSSNSRGCGTVFKITKSGNERVIYSFLGGTDGCNPAPVPIEVNGTLYGTTLHGGSAGCGTVYKITTTGSESVLYSFQGPSTDGCVPIVGLIEVNGTLYGTTTGGGTSTKCPNYDGCGTVFKITTSGSENVLYNFQGGKKDGSYPQGLINVKGTLYGTTATGSNRNPCTGGCGTVFRVTTSGQEQVLYAFKAGTDGASPDGLTDVKGTLYGTTGGGGGSVKCDYGCGTFFKVTTSGNETVLHRFQGGKRDGGYPALAMSLINVNGILYGDTQAGGTGSNCNFPKGYGCGTVFKITTSGATTILHSFQGATTDGSVPEGSLIDVSGMLYGVTAIGGTGTNCPPFGSQGYGCGTVFKTTP